MNTITINGYELPVKDYNEQRVVTFKDIDLVHGRPEGTAKRNFTENKQRFIDGIDYFKVCADEIRTNKICDISNKTHSDIILITESGYLMLVKSFTDDLAWRVQRQLVNSYFRLKKQAEFSPLDAETLEIEEMNARTRMSSQLLKLAKTKAIPKPYRDRLLEKSVEVLTGEKPAISDSDSIQESEVEENAKYILSRLKLKKVDEVSFREIVRLCQKIKKSEDFREPIALLIQNNYIIEIPTDYCGTGRKPLPKYKVIKA